MPIWAAILCGLWASLAWQIYLYVVRNGGMKVERLKWLIWLRDAWAQAGFNLDIAANVHGMDSPEEISAAFNAVLSSFEGWPGQTDEEVVNSTISINPAAFDGE